MDKCTCRLAAALLLGATAAFGDPLVSCEHDVCLDVQNAFSKDTGPPPKNCQVQTTIVAPPFQKARSCWLDDGDSCGDVSTDCQRWCSTKCPGPSWAHVRSYVHSDAGWCDHDIAICSTMVECPAQTFSYPSCQQCEPGFRRVLALEDGTSSYKMCIPCSDSVVTGMCSGNTDTSEDVRCGEEEAFLSFSGQHDPSYWQGKTQNKGPLASRYPDGPYGLFPPPFYWTEHNTYSGNPTEWKRGQQVMRCCESPRSGYCQGNADPSTDVICDPSDPDGKIYNKGGIWQGSDAEACCETTIRRRCGGNTDPSEDVNCTGSRSGDFNRGPGAVNQGYHLAGDAAWRERVTDICCTISDPNSFVHFSKQQSENEANSENSNIEYHCEGGMDRRPVEICPSGSVRTGHSETSGGTCSPCPAGTFKNNSAQGLPEPGEGNGHGTGHLQLGTCQTCPPGWHTDQANSTSCEPCPIAHFCQEGRKKRCPNGTYAQTNRYMHSMPGPPALSQCVACPPDDGNTRCKDGILFWCPSDRYAYWRLAVITHPRGFPWRIGECPHVNGRYTDPENCIRLWQGEFAFCLPCDNKMAACPAETELQGCGGMSRGVCRYVDHCAPNPCKNGAKCLNLPTYVNVSTRVVSNWQAHCDCRAGYSGPTCDIDIDDCNPNPCKNDGTCSDRVNGFSCTCAEGFTGEDCATELTCDFSSPVASGGDDLGNCTATVARGASCVPTCKTGFTRIGVSFCSKAGVRTEAVCQGKVCDFSTPPPNGGVGSCTGNEPKNADCQPTCNGAFVPDGPSRCDALGIASPAWCLSPCRLSNESILPFGTCLTGGMPEDKSMALSGHDCGEIDVAVMGFSCQSPGMCTDGNWANPDALCTPDPCTLAEEEVQPGIKCVFRADAAAEVSKRLGLDIKAGHEVGDSLLQQMRAALKVPANFTNKDLKLAWVADGHIVCTANENLMIFCSNNGHATGVTNACSCVCKDGYSGTHCETNIDDCKPTLCKNGGTCVDLVNAYSCSCPKGFSGMHCETNIDDCAAAGAVCLHGGTCVDGVHSFTCVCAPGWEGNRCENDIDECITKSNGNCAAVGAVCVNTNGSHSCSCASGYSGDGHVCSEIKCLPVEIAPAGTVAGASCPDGGSAAARTSCAFTCEPGFEFATSAATATCGTNGIWSTFPKCQPASDAPTVRNVCAGPNNPCTHNGTCIMSAHDPGSYTCACVHGFHGFHCEYDNRTAVVEFYPSSQCRREQTLSVETFLLGCSAREYSRRKGVWSRKSVCLGTALITMDFANTSDCSGDAFAQHEYRLSNDTHTASSSSSCSNATWFEHRDWWFQAKCPIISRGASGPAFTAPSSSTPLMPVMPPAAAPSSSTPLMPVMPPAASPSSSATLMPPETKVYIVLLKTALTGVSATAFVANHKLVEAFVQAVARWINVPRDAIRDVWACDRGAAHCPKPTNRRGRELLSSSCDVYYEVSSSSDQNMKLVERTATITTSAFQNNLEEAMMDEGLGTLKLTATPSTTVVKTSVDGAPGTPTDSNDNKDAADEKSGAIDDKDTNNGDGLPAFVVLLLALVAVLAIGAFAAVHVWKRRSAAANDGNKFGLSEVELHETTHDNPMRETGRLSSTASPKWEGRLESMVEIGKGGKMQWKQHATSEGKPYYEDAETGRTTWTRRDSEGKVLETMVETGNGGKMQWKQHATGEGKPYYEDAGTGRTTWTRRDSEGKAISS